MWYRVNYGEWMRLGLGSVVVLASSLGFLGPYLLACNRCPRFPEPREATLSCQQNAVGDGVVVVDVLQGLTYDTSCEILVGDVVTEELNAWDQLDTDGNLPGVLTVEDARLPSMCERFDILSVRCVDDPQCYGPL